MSKSRNYGDEDKRENERRERKRDWKDVTLKNNAENVSKREPKPGFKLQVENVDMSNRELEKLFSKFGPILRTSSRGSFSFVSFKHKDDADEALEGMKTFELKGKSMKVSYAPQENESNKKYNDANRNSRHNNHDSSKSYSDTFDNKRHKYDIPQRDKDTRIHRNSYSDRHPSRHTFSGSQTDMRRCYQCGRVGHMMRQCWNNRRDVSFSRGSARRPTNPYPRSLQPVRVANMLDDLTDVYADAK